MWLEKNLLLTFEIEVIEKIDTMAHAIYLPKMVVDIYATTLEVMVVEVPDNGNGYNGGSGPQSLHVSDNDFREGTQNFKQSMITVNSLIVLLHSQQQAQNNTTHTLATMQ